MPKTRNAFALRDFDAQRILQRPRFEELNLGSGKDEDILRSFLNVCKKPITEITFSEAEKVREMIAGLSLCTGWYTVCISRHIGRLYGMQRKYVEKFMSTDDDTCKQKIRRITELIKEYNNVLNVVNILRDKIDQWQQELKEFLAKADHDIFAIRLRQARIDKGYTQTQLAEKIGMTQGGYTAYENSRREPSVSIIKRLARRLNCQIDWLLGMTP